MFEKIKGSLNEFKEKEQLTINPITNIKRIIDDAWVYFFATFFLMLVDPVNIKFAEDGFSMFHLNLFVSSIIVMAGAIFSVEMLSIICSTKTNEEPFEYLKIIFIYILLKLCSCLTGLVAIVSGLGVAVNIGDGFGEQFVPIAYLLYPLLILTLFGIVNKFAENNKKTIKKRNAFGAIFVVVTGIGLSWFYQIFGLFKLN